MQNSIEVAVRLLAYSYIDHDLFPVYSNAAASKKRLRDLFDPAGVFVSDYLQK